MKESAQLWHKFSKELIPNQYFFINKEKTYIPWEYGR